MGTITLIINSIILFLVSNTYIINDTYNIKIPIIITILFVILLSIFPSLLNKKYYIKICYWYKSITYKFSNINTNIRYYILGRYY